MSMNQSDRAEANPEGVAWILLANLLVACAVVALPQALRDALRENHSDIENLWVGRAMITKNHVKPAVGIVGRAVADDRLV